jgi:hypothetical protein
MAISRPRYYNRKKRYKRKRGESKFKQGIYYPKNPDKFYQPVDETMNNTKGGVKYRSSWELSFAKYLDTSPNVIKWSAEPFAIKYFDSIQQKFRRYYIDFYFENKDGNKFLVEIKPSSQTGKGHTNNQDKWAYARQFAKERGLTFIIITEKELKKMKLI